MFECNILSIQLSECECQLADIQCNKMNTDINHCISLLMKYKDVLSEYPSNLMNYLNKLVSFWNNINDNTKINEFFEIKELHSFISEYDIKNPLWINYITKAQQIRLNLMKRSYYQI